MGAALHIHSTWILRYEQDPFKVQYAVIESCPILLLGFMCGGVYIFTFLVVFVKVRPPHWVAYRLNITFPRISPNVHNEMLTATSVLPCCSWQLYAWQIPPHICNHSLRRVIFAAQSFTRNLLRKLFTIKISFSTSFYVIIRNFSSI